MTSTAARSALGISVLVVASMALSGAQPRNASTAFVTRAADALGGAARLRAIKTITVAGYGEAAYMNGGGNISASPDAPQKWISIPEYEKTIDLEHGRMRVRQRNHQNFVFAGLAGYLGGAEPGRRVSRRRRRLQHGARMAARSAQRRRPRVPAASTC